MKSIIVWFLIIDAIVFSALYYSLISKLKNNYQDKYEYLEKPTMLSYLFGRKFYLVILFLITNSYKDMKDKSIIRFCSIMKFYSLVNIIISFILFFYFLLVICKKQGWGYSYENI